MISERIYDIEQRLIALENTRNRSSTLHNGSLRSSPEPSSLPLPSWRRHNSN